MLPEPNDPDATLDINLIENLFDAQADAYRLAHLLDNENIADVNQAICDGKTTELILSCEAIFNNNLSLIAQEIINAGKKFVFLAGPSSSGKTSTAYRLAYALRSYGIILIMRTEG